MSVVRVVVLERRPLVRQVVCDLVDRAPDMELRAGVAGPDDLAALTEQFDVLMHAGAQPWSAPRTTPTTPAVPYSDDDSPAEILRRVRAWRSQGGPARPAPAAAAPLTRRECEVLGGVADGLTVERIAALMGITGKSVENHKRRIFRKLGVNSQAHAVAVALDTGQLRGASSGTGRTPA